MGPLAFFMEHWGLRRPYDLSRAERGLGRELTAYAELTKPRITTMVLISTAAGYWTAGDDTWRLAGLLHTLCGTGLLAAGTAALNQWYERDTDALMRRTLRRPIPDGRIAPAHGLAFGLALSMLGVVYLIVETNVLAAAAGLARPGISP